MEAEEAESSTLQSSVVSSVVAVEDKRVEKTAEASRTRFLEKVKELDLEDLECRQELAEVLGLKHVSHEAHFSRARMMKTADLTGIPTKPVMGPINYRPLKLLGSPVLIVEPPKHRKSIARIRLATPAQLRVVDKLLDPMEIELPDAAYEGAKLADDPRYGKPSGNAQLAKTLAVYDSRSSGRESDHCDGIGLRRNVSQVILARDSSILAAGCRIEPDVDLGGGDKVGNALRTRAAAVYGYE